MKISWLGILALSLFTANAAAVDCSNLPNWENSAVYVGDDRVQHLNNAYTAKWWTQAQDPVTNSGTWDVWRYEGACCMCSCTTTAACPRRTTPRPTPPVPSI